MPDQISEQDNKRIRANLLGIGKEDYGSEYQTHILAIYQTYVEMVDRLYARRLSSNKFFLSINTAMIALLGYKSALTTNNVPFILVIVIAGLTLSVAWFFYIRSNRILRENAFRVIHEIEAHLPIRSYYAENEINNSSKYIGFTQIEKFIPWVFFAIFTFIAISNLITIIKAT